ncbi:hypothetical protein EKO27_g710 [Xylaria grammica]|uniref:Arf-GAP domain-containing protein n=1 Tax=Xylaria grammica TaxID=363999 RepID=A0A439DIZ0_9PEZI|nr:hypothetical protein EKO27_g710 [Xylaria grammica]
MAGLMSKRQQARNERALQDLVQSVPGNNLGIFLCMRCAAIHRKLGTHISKVKSLSMDSWTNEQVESMKRIGNAASNKNYNPQGKRPPVPVDADEADSAMERFIRSKYVQPASRTPTNGPTRHNTGSSDEGTPPPLPPKTGTRFFKSGTLSFRSKKDPQSPRESTSPQHNLPPRDDHLHNKPSKVFGASVHQDSVEATAVKLTQLRDMGFADDKRNAMILKGVNGNLEKTIEALIIDAEANKDGYEWSVTIQTEPSSPNREPIVAVQRSLGNTTCTAPIITVYWHIAKQKPFLQ